MYCLGIFVLYEYGNIIFMLKIFSVNCFIFINMKGLYINIMSNFCENVVFVFYF